MKRIPSLALLLALLGGLLLALVNPVSAQGNRYVVQSGDTLYGIAVRHGTTPEQLMLLNGLATTTIYVGQPLTLPGGNVAPAAVPSLGSHVVQPGENLFRIALRYGTTVDAVLAANGLATPMIYAGQLLQIPGAASMAAPPSAAGPAPATGWHSVAPGETLFSLALRYGSTVEALRQRNGLASDLIFVGQRLAVPGAVPAAPAPVAAGPVLYYVQGGDSLTHIAAIHGISVGALAQVNGIRVSDWVYVGQRLIIPSGAWEPAPPPAVTAPSLPGQHFYHIVRPGETLSWIATHYRTSVQGIASANRLADPSHIFVGQRLAIPGYQPPAVQARPPAPPAPAPRPASSPPPARPAPAAPPAAPLVPPAVPANSPPVVTQVWIGEVASEGCTESDTMDFRSVLRITVEGRSGQHVDLFATPVQDSNFVTWVKAGSKPELGPYGAEIAPLGAGNYTVVAQGLAAATLYLDGRCAAHVNFRVVNR